MFILFFSFDFNGKNCTMTLKYDKARKKRLYRMEVGTSGFMTSQKQWLSLPMLNCIEINSTFYRLPSSKMIESYQKLPLRVSFIFKVSRFITHLKRLNNIDEAWNNFWQPLIPISRQIVTILFQMPPSFHYNGENVRRIMALKEIIPINLIPSFEFRDKSWICEEVYDLFKKLRWCMVGTYIIKKEGSNWMGTMPSGLFIPPLSGNMTYVRVHGRRGCRGAIDSGKLEQLQQCILLQRSFLNICMFNNVFFDKRETSCLLGTESIKHAAVYNACQFELIGKVINQ